jgi:hypothetical protein
LRPGAPWRGRIGRFGLFGSSAISAQCRGARAPDRRRRSASGLD